MHADAIVREILPPALQTSAGWRNEILPSHPRLHQIHQNRTNFGYSGGNAVVQNRTNFGAGINTFGQNRTNFVQQRNVNEQEIIRRVEQAQIPPVIVHRKLPNNLVTYQQNVSVRYLQPPPLPPPGPLIIRTSSHRRSSTLTFLDV